jgi:hypothetical protein
MKPTADVTNGAGVGAMLAGNRIAPYNQREPGSSDRDHGIRDFQSSPFTMFKSDKKRR